MSNVDINNEFLVHYLCQNREAGLIGYSSAFSLEGRYRSVVHIGAISISSLTRLGVGKNNLRFPTQRSSVSMGLTTVVEVP